MSRRPLARRCHRGTIPLKYSAAATPTIASGVAFLFVLFF